MAEKGSSVKIRRGPATVTRSGIACVAHCFPLRENGKGAMLRLYLEPGDLPWNRCNRTHADEEVHVYHYGRIGIFSMRGEMLFLLFFL